MEQTFRYCPWCAAPQRLKITEFFHPHPAIADSDGRLLRISRYLGDREGEQHVRLRVWQDLGSERTRTKAAISIDEAEAGPTRLVPSRERATAASAAALLSPPPTWNATLRESNPRSF